jgi:hypothetical protein
MIGNEKGNTIKQRNIFMKKQGLKTKNELKST